MFFEKLTSLLGSGAPAASKPDVKTAVAELLVTASLIDGKMDDEEVAVRDRLLKNKFGLDDAGLAQLNSDALEASENAIDFYRFTSTIKEAYDREQRQTVVEMLCEIILADGKIDEDEMNMGWRIAGLLGFDNREWVMIRKQVEDRIQNDAPE
ncbi:MAG: TerB family tellurite resistance protein [Pseudomonadota bacterium]